jgi:hypothetical protein
VVRGVYLGFCYHCDYWGWYGGYWGWYHGGWWYPAHYPRWHRPPEDYGEPYAEPAGGQGYLPYPYALGGHAPQTFIAPRPIGREAFGAVSAQFFSDEGSTTRAGRFAFEGAIGLFRGEVEYMGYAEAVAGGTDRMHSFRMNVGVQPRLGSRAYLVGGVGVRGLAFEGGLDAVGPEMQLGVQLLPVRPLGAAVTGRLAPLYWEGGGSSTLREVNTTGSIFIGRLELQGGWHWMKVGTAPAFGGPVIGTRIWF